MERILLYYPSINIPDGNWLRNSLLYTDKVASIFPFENIEDERVNDETKALYDEGLYKPISAFKEFKPSDKELETFETNFIDTLNSEEFQKLQNIYQRYNRQKNLGFGDYAMYVNKLTENISDYLRHTNRLRFDYYEEVRVEKFSAIIYMSMLADYLACVNKDLVIPSTDQQEFERLAFQLADNKILTHRIQLDNCLPTPSPATSIKDIIKFKKKRKFELLQFREVLDKVESEINSTDNLADRKLKLIQFHEKIQKELIEIKKLLGDSKLDFALNCFSSLLDFKQKEVAGTATGLGLASAGLAASMPFVGLGAGALILSGTLVSSYKKINRQVESNSSSYLYFAQQAGILS
ncbi:DUF6236 family protein [Flavobacterium flavigenum]|uniref:DUF6236 family protein n=1 Tax=Flavobacterium flavigenum TaxID=3003258 RepID=UPI0022ABF1CC|nr:DUF6236 family protein [Flavobacterium flavigenum]